jgi:hypothetical protein
MKQAAQVGMARKAAIESEVNECSLAPILHAFILARFSPQRHRRRHSSLYVFRSSGKAATGSQTESRGIFQSSVSAFKLAGGRIHAMSARHGLQGPDQSRSPLREMPRR